MAFSKLFFVCSAAILCLFICSMSVSGANALDEGHHLGRREVHGHGGLAKRKRTSTTKKSSGSDRRRAKKRSGGGRCAVTPIANATSSLSSSASSASVHSSSSVPPAPAPSPTPSPSPAPAPAPPPVSSTSSAAAPPPSTAPSSGSGKTCLGWNADFGTLPNWITPHVRNYFTWSEWGDTSKSSGGTVSANGGTAMFMPMLWDASESKVSSFQQQVPLDGPPPAIILGFNEMNQGNEANFANGADAATAWKQYIAPYGVKGSKLASPSCSSASNAKQYYTDFFNNCADCQIDYMQLHWYGTEAAEFESYVKDMYSTFGRKLMITEFGFTNFGGAQPDYADTAAALAQAIDFMEGADYIYSYCVFGTLPQSAMAGVNENMEMMDSNGNPNALGVQYINVDWP